MKLTFQKIGKDVVPFADGHVLVVSGEKSKRQGMCALLTHDGPKAVEKVESRMANGRWVRGPKIETVDLDKVYLSGKKLVEAKADAIDAYAEAAKNESSRTSLHAKAAALRGTVGSKVEKVEKVETAKPTAAKPAAAAKTATPKNTRPAPVPVPAPVASKPAPVSTAKTKAERQAEADERLRALIAEAEGEVEQAQAG